MKKLISILLTALMLLSLATNGIAQEVEEVAPQIVDAQVVTYTTDEARSVAGIRIEYDQDILTGTYGLDSYYVNGYDVSAVYVSESGKFKDAAQTGRYVFAEFAMSQVPGYYEGKINFWTTDNTYADMTMDIFCQADNQWFTTTDNIHFEVEDYIEGSATNANDVTTLYRMFIPEGHKEAGALPLVVWFHGAGESGTDNTEQLIGNRGALNFSSKEAQAKNPCFVLAPQTNVGWSDDALENVHNVILEVIENYSIDTSRIYVIGCSMGGIGTRRMTQLYPDMVAAAVPIANNGCDDMMMMSRTAEDRTLYEGIPMLYITAADDMVLISRSQERAENERSIEAQMGFAIAEFEELGMKTYASIGADALNGYLRGELAAIEMQEVLDAAEEENADKIFVTYLAGTVLPAAHSSWMPATANTAVRDWMFSQVNDAPYAG